MVRRNYVKCVLVASTDTIRSRFAEHLFPLQFLSLTTQASSTAAGCCAGHECLWPFRLTNKQTIFQIVQSFKKQHLMPTKLLPAYIYSTLVTMVTKEMLLQCGWYRCRFNKKIGTASRKISLMGKLEVRKQKAHQPEVRHCGTRADTKRKRPAGSPRGGSSVVRFSVTCTYDGIECMHLIKKIFHI